MHRWYQGGQRRHRNKGKSATTTNIGVGTPPTTAIPAIIEQQS